MSRNHTLHRVCRTHGSHSKLGNRGAGVESKPAPRAEPPHLLRAMCTAVLQRRRDQCEGFKVVVPELALAAETAQLDRRQREFESVALGYIDALARMAGEAEADKTASTGPTAQTIKPPAGAVSFNIGIIVGSHASYARLLDEAEWPLSPPPKA
jgi:hypothetical protein